MKEEIPPEPSKGEEKVLSNSVKSDYSRGYDDAMKASRPQTGMRWTEKRINDFLEWIVISPFHFDSSGWLVDKTKVTSIDMIKEFEHWNPDLDQPSPTQSKNEKL